MRGGFSITKIVENNLDTFEPDNKVLIRIVYSLQNKGSTKKTQVQLDSKLRWDLFSKYWDWLNRQGFIKSDVINKSKNDYMLTPRGNEFFNLFQKYYDFIHMNIESKNKELTQILA